MRKKKKTTSLVVSMGVWLVLFDVLLLGGNAMEGYRDVFCSFLGERVRHCSSGCFERREMCARCSLIEEGMMGLLMTGTIANMVSPFHNL